MHPPRRDDRPRRRPVTVHPQPASGTASMPNASRARFAAALLLPLLAPTLLAGAVAAEPASPWRHASGVAAPAEHVVRMVLADGAYRFEPAEISAHPGDRITFVNESGGPHNVAFDPAQIDDALEARLAAGMPS